MDFEINLSTDIEPSAGKILISEPFLNDPFFKRTVILLCKHESEEGTFGLVLNRFLDVELSEVLNDFPSFGGRVGLGGPVEPSSMFFLHTRGDLITDSVQVFDNIRLGGDFERVKELIDLGLISEKEIRFFIGYSGWSKNQLDNELKEKSWLVTETSSKAIMEATDKHLWEQALKDLGKRFSMLANFPEDPSLN
ncbi:MAG: YqgE/AlgH family protein [Luteibaculum sp.]